MSDQTEYSSEVPSWAALVLPTVQVVSEEDGLHRKTIMDRVAQNLELSEAALAETLKTGGSRFEQRASWALSNATKAGWMVRPEKGHYAITDKGRAWLASSPEPLTLSTARTTFKDYWPDSRSKHGNDVDDADESLTSPEEQIDAGVTRINDAVGAELLSRLRESHPDFFETAVVKLLLAMGYGGAEGSGKRIGGSGDGGVDGVIDQDALGLDRIYIQAKRYADGNTVQREAIQAFVGALHGQTASRGVFITTSSFSSGAIEYARTVGLQVVLIDAKRLVDLMIQYRVGVQVVKTYATVEVDDNFFE